MNYKYFNQVEPLMLLTKEDRANNGDLKNYEKDLLLKYFPTIEPELTIKTSSKLFYNHQFNFIKSKNHNLNYFILSTNFIKVIHLARVNWLIISVKIIQYATRIMAGAK